MLNLLIHQKCLNSTINKWCKNMFIRCLEDQTTPQMEHWKKYILTQAYARCP